MEDFQIHTLSNGLRLLYRPSTHSNVSHVGFTINVGSREDAALPGTAHCFEHMLFKGTEKRKAWQIINRLDNVGGEMNAFTTKEITVLYASIINPYLERAIELLSDLCFHSNFPKKELEKEKKIIAEEINMYLDTPEENIYDEFQEMVFKGHSLAPNILGSPESLNAINSEHLLAFHKTYYHPENIVLTVGSSLPFKQIIKWAEKHCNVVHHTAENIKRVAFKHYQVQQQQKSTEHVQCHAILGQPAYAQQDPKRLGLMLLNNILGGPGMNSRLNISVRERMGYTYNVESGYTAFRDTGLFHCYLSTDFKNLHKAVDLVKKEMLQLKNKALSPVQLSHAKNQFNGQISLSEENRMNVLLMMGRHLAQGYPIESLEQVIQAVNAISAQALQEIANEIFDLDKISYLAYVSE